MPLTEEINFKATLQKGNRIQIPRLLRWQFKLEPQQVLKITVGLNGTGYDEEEFYSHMSKDGRIGIPKLTLELLTNEDEESLVDSVFEVKLEPVESAS